MTESGKQEAEIVQAAQVTVDPPVYEKIKPHLISALEQVIQTGHSVWDFADFAIDKFGDEIIPYLQKFLNEVRHGSVKLADTTECVWVGLFGAGIDKDQREQMIREAAYFRAQRRGLMGGDPNQDWIEAEQEIDSKLLADIGLFAKGRKLATEFVAVAEEEIGDVTKSVCSWLNDHATFRRTPH
jgi:hypothetical protein